MSRLGGKEEGIILGQSFLEERGSQKWMKSHAQV